MKKILIALVAVVAGATVQADIYMNFISSFGFEGPGGGTPLLTSNGQQALIQLIVDVDNDGIDGPAGIGGVTSGDDVVIFQAFSPAAIVGDGNTEYGLFTEIVGPVAGYAGGTVYGRIFQDVAASAGSWYYEGHLQVASNFIPPVGAPPLPTEEYDLGQGGAVFVNQQVIPEPATIGLMGVAGLGLFLARRKARR
jgi:hypothetical protein